MTSVYDDVSPGDLVRIKLRFRDELPYYGLVIQRELIEDDSLVPMITVLLAHNMKLERYAMYFLARI